MSKCCYLCDRKPSKNEYISVHGFPKNPTLRQKWKDVCGLTEIDDVSRVYICSVHFASENLKITKVAGNSRIILKPGAVPSISIRTGSPFEVVLINENVIDENVTSGNVDCLSSMDCVSVPQDVKHMESGVDSSSSADCEPLHQLRLETDQANHDCFDENYLSTPKKRRFHEPRYISEITLSDFDTLRKAQRTIQLIKDKNQERVKQIKCLHDINRHQKQHIAFLKEMINHLNEKVLMSPKVGDSLTCYTACEARQPVCHGSATEGVKIDNRKSIKERRSRSPVNN